jgi:hypothetical protein
VCSPPAEGWLAVAKGMPWWHDDILQDVEKEVHTRQAVLQATAAAAAVSATAAAAAAAA